MVERRKQPTTASQYCVRGTDSLLYQREHLATRWDGAVARGVTRMGNSGAVPFTKREVYGVPSCKVFTARVPLACCIFGTFITCHKFFNVPPSATADVVGSSDRPWATGMKETTVARTHRVCVSAPHKRPLCSSSELKN